MLRHLLIVLALAGAVFGIVDKDAVFATLMGCSFGFQLALWMVDAEQRKELKALRRADRPHK